MNSYYWLDVARFNPSYLLALANALREATLIRGGIFAQYLLPAVTMPTSLSSFQWNLKTELLARS